LPKIWWLKTTQIYFLTVPEARIPKSVLLDPNPGISEQYFFQHIKERICCLPLPELLVFCDYNPIPLIPASCHIGLFSEKELKQNKGQGQDSSVRAPT
jgi:hypothetical protein